MSDTPFIVPILEKAGAWLDFRHLEGGHGWRGSVPTSAMKKIVLHHTVYTPIGNARQEAMKVWAGRRYGGAPYHLLVTNEVIEYNGVEYAVIAYMGDLASIRAHAPNVKGADGLTARKGNEYGIGLSFFGDHRYKMPTEAMLRSAKLVIEELMIHDVRFSGIDSIDDTVGHGYWDFTWCPDGLEGKILKSLILDIKFENMGLNFDHPSIQSACEWDDVLTDKAKNSPMNPNTEPAPIIGSKTKENLERNANLGEVLLLISRYHYSLRSIFKFELEKRIDGLEITDEVAGKVRKEIAELLDPEETKE